MVFWMDVDFVATGFNVFIVPCNHAHERLLKFHALRFYFSNTEKTKDQRSAEKLPGKFVVLALKVLKPSDYRTDFVLLVYQLLYMFKLAI